MLRMMFWPFKLFNMALSIALNFIVLVACVSTLTGFWGEQGWLLELTSHFRVQYLFIQALAMALLLIRRRRYWRQWLAVFTVFAGLNLWHIAPFWVYPHPANPPSVSLRILHLNVFKFNPNRQAVIDTIRRVQPDVLSVQEMNNGWRKDLQEAGVFDDYPHQVIHEFSQNGLFIRNVPVESIRSEPIPGARAGIFVERGEGSTLLATVRLGGERVTLINLHPATPINGKFYDLQRRHFRHVLDQRGKYADHIVLFGDLNTTPWSHTYGLLTRELGLRNARLGFGVQPSWPSYVPPFFIPIDHVLVSERFVVRQHMLGPFTGSDHLPVYVELGLKK